MRKEKRSQSIKDDKGRGSAVCHCIIYSHQFLRIANGTGFELVYRVSIKLENRSGPVEERPLFVGAQDITARQISSGSIAGFCALPESPRWWPPP